MALEYILSFGQLGPAEIGVAFRSRAIAKHAACIFKLPEPSLTPEASLHLSKAV